VNSIDVANRRLGYFHNRGYHELEGRDYEGLFRSEGPADARILAPYVEMVKLHRLRRPDAGALARIALAQARKHFSRKPSHNPLRAFASSFARDVEWLGKEPMASFHAYSFATLRQLGANFECAAGFARWLAPLAGLDLEAPARAFHDIASAAKAMQFRLARVPAGKKYDGTASLQAMAQAWQEAMASLAHALG
jgi:hypothetical protein